MSIARSHDTKNQDIPFGIARGMLMHVDFRCDTAFFWGLYESELDHHYRRLVHRAVTCFDVGAHRGWDSLLLPNWFPPYFCDDRYT